MFWFLLCSAMCIFLLVLSANPHSFYFSSKLTGASERIQGEYHRIIKHSKMDVKKKFQVAVGFFLGEYEGRMAAIRYAMMVMIHSGYKQ